MMKLKNFLRFLFLHFIGRYLLGIIIAVTGGVFSEYSTIEFLSTDYELFTYITTLGIIIICGNFLFHVFYAVYLNIKK